MRINKENNNERETDETIYRVRADPNISDTHRMKLVFTEFELLDKDLDIKLGETKCKSNWYNVINTGIMLTILLCSAVIVGLQTASECLNIPVITLAAIIFVAQGADKLFSLGNQGMFYKQGTIKLRKIKRDVREIIYRFHKFVLDEALFLIGKLRDEFDEIDLGLYKISVSGQARYNGSDFNVIPNIQHEATLPGLMNVTPGGTPPIGTPQNTPPPSHVHIHIDGHELTPQSDNSQRDVSPPSPVIEINDIYDTL